MTERQRLTIGYLCRIKGHRHPTEDSAADCARKTAWLERFDERQKAEISFSILYAEQFAHGTDGHNAKLIIAQMAGMLTEQTEDAQRQEHLQRAFESIAAKKV